MEVIDSLGVELGPDVVPRSRSDVDEEANLDQADSTFLDQSPRVWGPIRVSGVRQRGSQRKVRSVGRRGQR